MSLSLSRERWLEWRTGADTSHSVNECGGGRSSRTGDAKKEGEGRTDRDAAKRVVMDERSELLVPTMFYIPEISNYTSIETLFTIMVDVLRTP